MISKYYLILLLLLAATHHLSADCFTTFFEEGQRLAEALQYENALAQYRAATRCPGVTADRRKALDQAIEEAQ